MKKPLLLLVGFAFMFSCSNDEVTSSNESAKLDAQRHCASQSVLET